MKKLKLLKTILDLAYFFIIVAAVGMLILIPIIFSKGAELPITIKGQQLIVDNLAARVLLIALSVSTALFFYAIFLFREAVKFFVKRDIFNDAVSMYLNECGIFIVASSLLSTLSMFVYNMIGRNNVGLEFGVGGFDSFLLSISLGLFFMVLAEVFKIAKNLKDENSMII